MKVKYTKNFKGLDKLLYPNGGIYFREKKNAKLGIKPLVVHVNYAQGIEAKQNLLKEGNMWYLGDAEIKLLN
jgi:hypothetical protein